MIDLPDKLCQQNAPGSVDRDDILSVQDGNARSDLRILDLGRNQMYPHDAGPLGVQSRVMDLVEVSRCIGQFPFICFHCHTSLLYAAGKAAGSGLLFFFELAADPAQ